MNIRDLKYLVAVAEFGHFGQAAAASFVSQPTLSMQLKKLEEELGVVLFERTNKQVLITDIGKKILEQARLVLLAVDELKELAAMAQDPLSGELKLGVIPTLAPYVLPQVMPALNQAFPQLSLFLIEEKTPVLCEKLSQGELDAAMMALPVEEEFEQSLLFNEPFFVACSNTHPFAKKTAIHLKDIDDEVIMLLAEGHCLRSQALEICQQVESNKPANFSATSLETLRLMVAAGMGITLMPALSIIEDKTQGLSIIPFSDSIPTRQIAMMWRKKSPKTECVSSIAKVIHSVITDCLKKHLL